jgi:hypothetical protein
MKLKMVCEIIIEYFKLLIAFIIIEATEYATVTVRMSDKVVKLLIMTFVTAV